MPIDRYGFHISRRRKHALKTSDVGKRFRDTIDLENARLIHSPKPENETDVANKAYVDAQSQLKNQPFSAIDLNWKILRNVGNPTKTADAVSYQYVKEHSPFMINTDGFNCSNKRLIDAADPINNQDVVTLAYLKKHYIAKRSDGAT